GCDRAPRDGVRTPERGLHGMVRPSRPRVRRVHPHRVRGAARTGPRRARPRRGRDLDGAPVRLRARLDGWAARCALRRVDPASWGHARAGRAPRPARSPERDVMSAGPDASQAPERPSAKDMVWIAGGSFLMGSEDFYPE